MLTGICVFDNRSSGQALKFVLDKNITDIPTKEISTTKVLSMFLDGKIVFDKPGLF